MSSETMLFDIVWGDAARRHRDAVAARLEPQADAVPVFPTYDLDKQFRVMQQVANHAAIPVPRVRWLEPRPAAIGCPFFVMDRVEGAVPPDVMPYNFGDSWLFDASDDDRHRLQERSVGVLAALHTIAHPERDFAFLAGEGTGSPLRGHVEATRAYYEWVAADGLRSSVIERAFEWLDDHWPREEGPTVVSWGDARIGNIMYRDFEPVAVLDWEMAALAPPEVDVAWMVYLHRMFEDLAIQYGLPGMPSFMRRDDVASTYGRLTGYAPRDLDFYGTYAAVRFGIIISRTQRRAISFGEAELPEDPDDLLSNRHPLEAMVEGSYWEQFSGTG